MLHLYNLPLFFILVGLVLYIVLAGADFGAGFWQLTAGGGPEGERLRNHAHESIGPVWEANHVWLIFVITVFWTAYPVAFGSIFSTLAVPLFLAAIGIILRGAAYALRAGASSPREARSIDMLFSISSIVTPFALGTVVGALAAGRVPVGNAAGDMFTSWLNPTAIVIGLIGVTSAAYLAAVFLSADAVRLAEPDLAERFRVRALAAGTVAGALAVVGLVVLHGDAHRLFHRLIAGPGLPALIVSILAGVAALGLVVGRRYAPARYVAAIAVTAVIAGWAVAQNPILLPRLTVQQAAAPHDTLVTVVIAVLVGGAILFPALGLLFSLVLRGRFDHGPAPEAAIRASDTAPATPVSGRMILAATTDGLLGRIALGCLIAGFGFLTVADAPWAHAIGVVALVAFVIVGFAYVEPARLAQGGGDGAGAAGPAPPAPPPVTRR